MGLVKNIITKITRAMASRDPVRYARKLGVNIADDVFFSGIPDFGSEPWLVEIRSQVWLTQNVRFMCHDGSVHTIKWTDKKYNQTCKVGRIVVDEGSFIGANTMIMPNVYIGKGAVIGACSMVTKDIPDGEVFQQGASVLYEKWRKDGMPFVTKTQIEIFILGKHSVSGLLMWLIFIGKQNTASIMQ